MGALMTAPTSLGVLGIKLGNSGPVFRVALKWHSSLLIVLESNKGNQSQAQGDSPAILMRPQA